MQLMTRTKTSLVKKPQIVTPALVLEHSDSTAQHQAFYILPRKESDLFV